MVFGTGFAAWVGNTTNHFSAGERAGLLEIDTLRRDLCFDAVAACFVVQETGGLERETGVELKLFVRPRLETAARNERSRGRIRARLLLCGRGRDYYAISATDWVVPGQHVGATHRGKNKERTPIFTGTHTNYGVAHRPLEQRTNNGDGWHMILLRLAANRQNKMVAGK